MARRTRPLASLPSPRSLFFLVSLLLAHVCSASLPAQAQADLDALPEGGPKEHARAQAQGRALGRFLQNDATLRFDTNGELFVVDIAYRDRAAEDEAEADRKHKKHKKHKKQKEQKEEKDGKKKKKEEPERRRRRSPTTRPRDTFQTVRTHTRAFDKESERAIKRQRESARACVRGRSSSLAWHTLAVFVREEVC